MDVQQLQRAFFDGLYTYRIALAIGSAVAVALLVNLARRRGWLAHARRHPMPATALAVAALAIGLPLTWYVASPLFIRTELFEPVPRAVLPTARPAPVSPAPSIAPAPASEPPSAAPPPTPPAPSVVASGAFHGTDDFHFGRGTAALIETAPGVYLLRFEDFSVRNGPDLFVYLSPDPADYADGAVELGRLKATDGSFGYELPAGTDPAAFASAIVWCKQFSHLFAVAPLEARRVGS